MAITVALHFCDVVDIAGFGYPSSDDKKQSIHYYEHVTVKSMAVSNLISSLLKKIRELIRTETVPASYLCLIGRGIY